MPDDKARDVPDISLAASANHVGYQVFVYGGLYAVGGTSASAPSLAGVVALLNQYLTSKSVLAKPGLGNINPTLYRLAQSSNNIFHDVTTGDNAVRCALGTPNCVEGFVGYRAGPGYDQATGLGSIDAYNLVTQWNLGTASTTTVTADPAKAGLNDTVRLTATVRGSTAGAAPTGAVSFLAENVVVAVIGTADLTPNGATSTATLAVPATSVIGGNGVVTAMYNGDKLYNASSATVTVGVNRPAAGSLVVPYITPSPVYKQSPDGNWPYTVMLTEKAGVQTTLTVFTVNGVNNLGAFGTGTIVIPAKGTLAVALAGNNLTVPIDRVFHFEGKDLDGTAVVARCHRPVPGCHLFRSVHRHGAAQRARHRAPEPEGRRGLPVYPPPHRPGDRRFPDADHRPAPGHYRFERFAPATLRHRAPGALWNAAGRYLPEQRHQPGSQDLHHHRNQPNSATP